MISILSENSDRHLAFELDLKSMIITDLIKHINLQSIKDKSYRRLLHSAKYCIDNLTSFSYEEIINLEGSHFLNLRKITINPKSSRLVTIKVSPQYKKSSQDMLFGFHPKIADSLNDAILIAQAEPLDEKGPRVLYVNAAFERMTGYLKQDIFGKTPRILQGPDTNPIERSKIRLALEKWSSVRAELLNYKKNGSPFYVELDISPIADETGWWTHWVAVQRDITDRRIKENSKLTKSIVEITELLSSGIAHDLNNKISLINNQLLLMRKKYSLPLEANECLENISSKLVSLKSITKQFFKNKKGSHEVVTVPKIIDEIEKIIRFSVVKKEVSLIINNNSAQSLYPVKIKIHCLEQILSNLLINASEALDKQVHPHIRVDIDMYRLTDSGPNFLKIIITDNGSGIPLHIQESLFSPYLTSKPNGNGFGLYISQINVKELEGYLTLLRSNSSGSSFEIGFPVFPADNLSTKKSEQKVIRKLKKGPVLLIDDQADLTMTFKELLEYHSIECEVSFNAKEAIEKINNTDYSLIITDLNLGKEFLTDKIIHAAKSRNIITPVIVMSGGNAFDDERISGVIEMYPDLQIWTKPFEITKVVNLFSGVN